MIDINDPHRTIHGLAVALKAEMKRVLRMYDSKGGCDVNGYALFAREYYLNK